VQKKTSLWVRKKLTQERFKEFLKIFKIVGVIILKKEEPIFSLHLSFSKPHLCVVIHKGSVITKRGGSLHFSKYDGCDKKVYTITEGKPVSVGEYINQNKYELYYSPCRRFLIDTVVDKSIKSEPIYIAPIRDLFRKYGILHEKRGKTKKVSELKKERDRLITKLYKDILNKTKRSKPLPITNIYNKLTDYDVSFATIRRVINNYIKK